MPTKRYRIKLTKAEREELRELINKGKESARKLTHARILLEADEGKDGPGRLDAEISERVHVSVPTIERVRKQCVIEGLERALNHRRPWRGKPKRLDGEGDAKLVQLACSTPPSGRAQWSLQLLADELVRLEVVDSIAKETVRRQLKKMNLSLG